MAGVDMVQEQASNFSSCSTKLQDIRLQTWLDERNVSFYLSTNLYTKKNGSSQAIYNATSHES